MSDSDNNDDDFHEDESDQENDDDEEDGDSDEEFIETYITNHPLVEIGETYDRRTVIEIEVKKGVTEIPNNTFRCSRRLSKIKLPTSLKSIGNSAIALCKSLNSTLTGIRV